MTSEQTPLLSGHPVDAPSHQAESTLIRFRNAIGINVTTPSSQPHEIENARSKPSGIYAEVIKIQRSRARQYFLIEALYYSALISQILIGAILAALGSLAVQHPTAVTILGMVNTATAGILALLKGQGLPDRLRKDEFEMKKVQRFIEETDTRLAIEDGDGHAQAGELEDIVDQVFNMYNTATDTAEMNHPSNYARQVDGPEDAAQGPGQQGGEGAEHGEHDDGPVKSVKRSATNRTTRSKGKFVIT